MLFISIMQAMQIMIEVLYILKYFEDNAKIICILKYCEN